MRDSDILQAKTAAYLLSGMKDASQSYPVVRYPKPAYEITAMEQEAERA